MLIAIEGIDGAGKQTQTALLRERLEGERRTTALFSFPRYGETFFAASITDYLAGRFGPLDAVDPHFAALLYAGDRLESKPLLQAAATSVDVVLCDRYVASNLAHQGARVPATRREAFLLWVATLEHETYGLPRADLTLFLDLPSRAAGTLIETRGQQASSATPADIHEADLSYLERCRRVYQDLAAGQFYSRWQRIACLDAAGRLRAPASIASEVWERVQPVIARSAGDEVTF